MPMSRRYRYQLPLLALLFAGAGVPIQTKWVELFNGRDLSGWTHRLADPNAKPESVWSIKDGVLRCSGKPAGYLITKQNTFENYVLSLDWEMAR